ncbi:MAG TPA: DUF2793 domain-containing protein [Sphingomicrobium sp.]|jgi:hypothetical protein|nr:DUF2793 domain-containing protein [Sphingomicrobium sp.]
MSTTPRLGITELALQQAVPETRVNEAINILELFSTRCIVKDRDLTAPPGSPANGDSYLVAAGATGSWSGQDGKLAHRLNGAWIFRSPKEGFEIVVEDEDIALTYYNGAWVGADAAPEASVAEVREGATGAKYVSPRRLFEAAASVALTDGATITPDFGTGINFHVTLGGNRTLANPTNVKAGQSGRIRIVQDGTGGRTLSFGSNWKFAGGTPSLSIAAGAVDVIAFFCHSATEIEATIVKALA